LAIPFLDEGWMESTDHLQMFWDYWTVLFSQRPVNY